ncbi:MAG TPA: NAD(P)/FAD-dependent oxidoreductase [Steroidobacteraceae bacterium]|jgi:phytoene dehydrogenase-like protein
MSVAVRYDCIVIGAGHNGLVCAALLARAGRSVLVLESAEAVGGAACTREFAPGYRVSAGAHLLHMMPSSIVSELALESHGLKFAARSMPTSILTAGGAPQTLGTGLSQADAAQFDAYNERLARFARALVPLFSSVPPRLGTEDWGDRLALLKLGWSVRKLGRRDMRELLRIGGMNVHDLLEESFESQALKGALALDAVLGANFGPRSPGTVLTLLYRLAGESSAGIPGHTLAQPAGGMGALSEALAKAAAGAGVAIRTRSEVRRILVDDDRAIGVELSNGERIGGRAVISNADPKTTFLKLLGAAQLDTGFVRRVHHVRGKGLAAKLHIALKRPPLFAGATEAQLRGRLVLAPSLEYVEHAYNHSKYGEYSAQPALEVTVPTANDASLAPGGHHVMSVVAQYAPYALRGGWTEAARQGFTNAILDQLEALAPGLRESIAAVQLLTPLDLEASFGMSGGHWHHGDLAFDQFLMVRPVPGAAQYRTPLPGLYLCGAGCHPGGGVMGVAGRNAAAQVLKGAA